MEEYLVCVHAFYGSAMESLDEAISYDHVGMLLYAVKIVGPNYAQMLDILYPSHIDPYTGHKVVTSCSETPLEPALLNPLHLIESFDHDEGFVERRASRVNFFTLDAARKFWNPVEIASACANFNRWLRSTDGTLERPSNLQCEKIRRVMAECALIAEFAPSLPASLPTSPQPPEKPTPTEPKTEDNTTRTEDDVKRSIANRQLAFDAAVDILVEAALEHGPIPTSTVVAEQVAKKGKLDVSEKTFRNVLSRTPAWKGLMHQVKIRPDNRNSRAYREWRENFEKLLPFFRQQLIQRSDEGISDEERSVSLKKLARLAEKKKKPAKKPGKSKVAKRSSKKTTKKKNPSE